LSIVCLLAISRQPFLGSGLWALGSRLWTLGFALKLFIYHLPTQHRHKRCVLDPVRSLEGLYPRAYGRYPKPKAQSL